MTTKKMRLAAAGLATSVAATLGVTMTAAPAHAATSIGYCFVNTNGSPLDRNITTVYAWYNNGWNRIGEDRTGTTGCSSISVWYWQNYHIRVEAGTLTDRVSGWTPKYSLPGNNGHAHLGTGVAYYSYA